MVMVTGAGPQSNVMTPPAATAVDDRGRRAARRACRCRSTRSGSPGVHRAGPRPGPRRCRRGCRGSAAPGAASSRSGSATRPRWPRVARTRVRTQAPRPAPKRRGRAPRRPASRAGRRRRSRREPRRSSGRGWWQAESAPHDARWQHAPRTVERGCRFSDGRFVAGVIGPGRASRKRTKTWRSTSCSSMATRRSGRTPRPRSGCASRRDTGVSPPRRVRRCRTGTS